MTQGPTNNKQNNSMAVRQALSDVLVESDAMYGIIEETLSALDTVTVDGCSQQIINPVLQAYTNKQFLPDTEIEMLHTKALPMSDDDIKQSKRRQVRLDSVQYRKEQLKIPTKTLTEITGARLRVAYRLVRYMSHVRGIGGVGKPLTFSMASSNPQINVFELPLPYNPTVGWYRGLAAVRNLLAQAQEGPYEYTYLLNGDRYTTKGMSVLPPPLHDGYYPHGGKKTPIWEYRRRQYVPEQYRAEYDAPLAIYLNICELLIRHLGIADTDVDDQAAVAALLNPNIARLSWPCRDEIETFEEYVLLPYVGRIAIDNAQDAAIEVLKDEMSLTHSEAFDLIETYKTYSQQANIFDPERERSIMLTKLHRLAQECDGAGMVTTQHNTFKTILQVLGLTRHEDDSSLDKRANLESVLEGEIVGQAKNIEDDADTNEIVSTAGK